MTSDPILAIHDLRLVEEDTRISLEIGPSEFVVLAGPAGAEKSEFLMTAAGFRVARSGTIRLLGSELVRRRATDDRALRRRTAFVFQEPVFIHDLSTLENIRLPLNYDDRLPAPAIEERVRSVLQYAGLPADPPRAPDSLSPLDRRRLALACAWVREPEIVFYDEPARSLDQAAQKKIYQAVARYHRARKQEGRPAAALVACTDPRWVLEHADRFLVLNAGTLTSKADPTNIRGRQQALEREFLDLIESS
jgi:ABC-type transporter Mla maintaining outer membrane lipid asymmetry ATPase subunit MlaF